MGLTEAQMRVLGRGFLGPRPGSNFFPLLVASEDDGSGAVDGEDIERLLREGVLIAAPAINPGVLPGNPTRDIPDIELTHAYSLRAPTPSRHREAPR